MVSKLLLIVLFVFSCGAIMAQSVSITNEDHPINDDAPNKVHVEPHLAINPTNPRHMVAASIVLDGDFSNWSSSVFTSFDGGHSWARHDFDMERCIDPWVTINNDGSVFITAIEILRDVKNDRRFNMLLYNSADGGITWNTDKNSLGRGFDHEMVIPSDADRRTYYLLARKARDLDADSTLYDFYLGGSKNAGLNFDVITKFKPEGTPKDITPTGMEVVNNDLSIISFIEFPTFLTKSVQLRNDKNVSKPVVISDKCGDCSSFPGYPYLAKGINSNMLHHVCIGEEFDGIWYSRSKDAANTWEEAFRLDDLPKEGIAHVRTPMLAVNHQGVIGVAWYDRRNDPENKCQDIYFSASIR